MMVTLFISLAGMDRFEGEMVYQLVYHGGLIKGLSHPIKAMCLLSALQRISCLNPGIESAKDGGDIRKAMID